MKRFALYSSVLPPLISGQTIILDRLLNNFKTTDYILMSTKKHRLNLNRDLNSAKRYFYLSDYYQFIIIKLMKH